jgi:hypothetical protein
MAMPRGQNAGRIHKNKIDNRYIEVVEKLKYFGTTYRNQNSIQKKVKCRLK